MKKVVFEENVAINSPSGSGGEKKYMAKLSDYVLTTESFDKEYRLLYNLKNEYFLNYKIEDFGDLDQFIQNDEVIDFLNSKDFFASENELDVINSIHKRSVNSKDSMMLILKVTKKCNFKCIYCYEDTNKKNMDEVTVEILKRFLENTFKKEKIKHLIISWFGGEPLVNKKFIYEMAPIVIKLCKKYNVKYDSTIVTNCYLLDKDTCMKLISLGVNTFQITIDGPESIHNSQRISKTGEGTYKSIINNVYALSKLSGDFVVVLRTNVSKAVIGTMDSYVDDILPLFNDKRFYAKFHPVVDFETMEHDVTDLEIVKEMTKYLLKGVRFPSVREYLSPSAFYCYASKENHYVIDGECNISKCTEVNEEYSYVGKLNENGKILFNCNNLLWSNAKYSNKCGSCKNFVLCDGGVCPLYYLKHNCSRCMNFKTEKEYLLKIADLQKTYNMVLHL